MFAAALLIQRKGGDNPNVYELMSGQTKCGMSTEWNVIRH